MESNPARYYKPSGAVPLVGTILMQLLGAAGAVLLGGAYAAANFYSPSVWLTGFAVLILGAGVGFCVNLGAKIGKVRNVGFVSLLGLAMGVLAVYVAWVFYIYLFGRKLGLPIPLIWDPSVIFEAMKGFAETGIWSIKSWTPTGWVLWMFWVAEGSCVVLLSWLVAVADNTPYCDRCNVWTKKAKDVASFALMDQEKLKSDLEDERYEVLDQLHQQGADPKHCLKAEIHSCPRCEDSDFLTVKHSQVVTDSDGNDSTQETEWVTNLRIPRDVVEHLTNLGTAAAPAATEASPDDDLEF